MSTKFEKLKAYLRRRLWRAERRLASYDERMLEAARGVDIPSYPV